jgi:His-Xaa-Ser system radical SAM maturase HxsC
MCCQPPKKDDDIEFLYQKNIQLIHSAPKELKVLGITGGEPTLLGEKLVDLLTEVRNCLPNTTIQLLSNGRGFKDLKYTHRIAQAAGNEFFVGIPLHSDYLKDHDAIAGSKHAFEETMIGLYNLASEGVEIELRVVVNVMNYKRLPQMSEFIFKNLPFVSWVAFMGMERIGHSVKNESSIWIEPINYVPFLKEAVEILDGWGIAVAIYNIPLCLLPQECWPFAKKSISDWKIKYLQICNNCDEKTNCCGLFSTSISCFKGLRPLC